MTISEHIENDNWLGFTIEGICYGWRIKKERQDRLVTKYTRRYGHYWNKEGE